MIDGDGNDSAGFERLAGQVTGQRGRPPVERWHPPLSGDIDIRIDRDGNWHHEGELIQREALVRLFASILRREADGCHYLVTPVEKWRIQVDDAPLIAVDVDREQGPQGPSLWFVLNTGERAMAGPRFPLQVEADTDTGAPRPYLQLDRGLRALLSRALFYRLVDGAKERDGRWWVHSDGVDFPLG